MVKAHEPLLATVTGTGCAVMVGGLVLTVTWPVMVMEATSICGFVAMVPLMKAPKARPSNELARMVLVLTIFEKRMGPDSSEPLKIALLIIRFPDPAGSRVILKDIVLAASIGTVKVSTGLVDRVVAPGLAYVPRLTPLPSNS